MNLPKSTSLCNFKTAAATTNNKHLYGYHIDIYFQSPRAHTFTTPNGTVEGKAREF